MGSKKRKGLNSKAKGARGEYALRDILSKWWGFPFRRTPGSGAWGTINDTDTMQGDLICDDPSFPYSIEIKFRENWRLEQLLLNDRCPIMDWWNQAVTQCEQGKYPMLVFKKNREKFLVAVFASHAPEDLTGKMFYFDHPDYDEHILMFPVDELICTNPYLWGPHKGLHNKEDV